jgi:hypothetical protein
MPIASFRVPWLTDQIDFAASGIEAVAGIISVDSFEEHGPAVPARFHSSYSIYCQCRNKTPAILPVLPIINLGGDAVSTLQ